MSAMEDFYKNEWGGSCSDEELPTLLLRAEIIVNNAIMMSGITVENAPETLKKPLYLAVCAQADYISENGGISALSESCSGGSVSLGKFSYSVGGLEGGGASLCGLCPQASAILETAGLLYRGVDVL